MKIKITAGGIYGADGVEVPVGAQVDVTEEPKAWMGRYTVLSGGETDDGQVAITNPAVEPPVLPLVANDQGGGWWAVTDAAGKPWGKKLRKDDAEAFNTLSDEDRVAFVTEG